MEVNWDAKSKCLFAPVALTESPPAGVDTRADLKRVRASLEHKH
jgi:CMP-2-keto-3-deoxyoctulosonic acid synthetase